jgi:hypothetical protein
MGHTYAGPGATIGPAITFGYLAALDIAQRAAMPHGGAEPAAMPHGGAERAMMPPGGAERTMMPHGGAEPAAAATTSSEDLHSAN